MKKYIKIVNYMSGPSLQMQIVEIEDAGMMDKDTRLFFKKHNSLSMGDVAALMHQFDLELDDEFSDDNVVLVPKDWYIQSLEGK